MIKDQTILVADSGSTKTAWAFTDGTAQESFISSGANPVFRSSEEMVSEWKKSPVQFLCGKVSQVYFYGAGVINDEKAAVVDKALSFFFPGAAIYVASDLLAAAHATLGDNSGIACILGTGSNSCLYDGREITQHVPPLGFILGDEGSGAVMGRQLIGDYLKKMMPDELRGLFYTDYPLEYGEILNKVYRQELPSRFLGGFMPFLKKNIAHTYSSKLVEKAFESFIIRNVAQYEGYKTHQLNFTGSVAFHFQEQLKQVLVRRNLQLGKIVKEPLYDLLQYHLRHI